MATVNASKGVKQQELSYIPCGNAKWFRHFGSQFGSFFRKLNQLLACVCVCVCVCVCACSVTQSYPTLCNSIDYSHQTPLSMKFSRHEYWSELPFPPLGDLLDSELSYLSCTDWFFTISTNGKPLGSCMV